MCAFCRQRPAAAGHPFCGRTCSGKAQAAGWQGGRTRLAPSPFSDLAEYAIDLPFPLSTVDAAVLGHLVVDPLEEAIAQGWQGIKSSGSSGAPFSHNRNSAADVLGRALDGEVELAYFVRPPTVQQVVSVASEGLLLPPKSTNFTPKPTKGLLMNSLRSF